MYGRETSVDVMQLVHDTNATQAQTHFLQTPLFLPFFILVELTHIRWKEINVDQWA